MEDYLSAGKENLNTELSVLQKRYDDFKTLNLKLDMTRGKPGPDQLDLAMDMLKSLDFKTTDGLDCRNYGIVDGIPEAKALFAEMLDVDIKEIIIGGNSSLSMMYDTIARSLLLGVFGSGIPWGRLPKVKFLCPSPGYDRHFAVCEQFNIEMIQVDMKKDGPDMDEVEKLAASDDSIKGIWCVPTYSNPEGTTYSDDVVRRFAKMKTKANDFRIFWDNAYAIHHLSDKPDRLLNIMKECREAGNPDRVFIFSSTSKISFAGSGVAMMAASEGNINHIKKQLSIQTIGPDKINQLRHVKFYKNMDGITAHMKKHASILKPKFDIVLSILEKELDGKNIAFWNKPNGGYFISLNILDGCAKEVVALAGEAGAILTKAGATFPYGKDPKDRNIRIAPTFPSVEELKKAIELLSICIKIICINSILKGK